MHTRSTRSHEMYASSIDWQFDQKDFGVKSRMRANTVDYKQHLERDDWLQPGTIIVNSITIITNTISVRTTEAARPDMIRVRRTGQKWACNRPESFRSISFECIPYSIRAKCQSSKLELDRETKFAERLEKMRSFSIGNKF